MSKSTMKIIGWVVSIVIAIIGTFGATTAINNKNNNKNSNKNDNKQTQNQTQEQKQEQNISITINGEKVEINKDNAQEVYGDIENERDTLQLTVDNLNKELKDYKQYGKEALVNINPSYEADKVSLFSFDSVNENNWKKNEGSLKDSLGNTYDASLPYVVMGGGSYGEYYPNGKFKKLKLTIAPNENMEVDRTATVKVMIDDDLTVLELKNVSRKTEPKSYTIDLKGAHFVKIYCERTSPGWDSEIGIMVLDATLIK